MFIEMTKMNRTTVYDYNSKIFIPMDNLRQTTQEKQKRIVIETNGSSSCLKNIGLRLNTNVHLRTKKRPIFKDVMIALLLCICIIQGILNYLKYKDVSIELDYAKRQLKVLGENVARLSHSVHNLKNSIELLTLENFELKKRNHHSVNKRETDQLPCPVNGTDSYTQAPDRGPYSVHLRGASPEISVRDGGIVGPWCIDEASTGAFLLSDDVIEVRKGTVKIVEEGLYFIYAQIYYVTASSFNSYAINLQLGSGSGRDDVVVAVCSAEAASNKLSELSCYTAVVRYLHRGDKIFVTQREPNRRIIFRENKSFIGLTLLNSHRGFIQ